MKQLWVKITAERLQSFRFAFNGILGFFRQEPNAKMHLIATMLVLAAVLYFPVSGMELALLVIVAGAVWVSELFNTVVERIMDFVAPEYHPKVEFIKDLSAGAVLLSALTALVTGAIIFIPKIF